MKDVPADTPFIFFHRFICVSPLQDFVGGHGMLICSAGHDRPSRACSAPSSMPNDLKYKAIVADLSATDSGENRAVVFAVESHTPTLVLHPKELTAEWVGERFYPRRS